MRNSEPNKNCEGLTRRNCLQLGLGTFIGGGLASALRAREAAATSAPTTTAARRKNTSCILVWLDGGPTHYETFDPKPDAPKEIRGILDPIATRVPGMHFSEHLKKLAAVSDKLAVIRSIRHNHGNHGAGNHYMMTGAPTRIPVSCGAFVSFHPSMGSMTAQARGAPEGLPPYFSLPRMSRSGGPNFLGSRHAPFVVPDDPNNKSFRVRDVALPAELTSGQFEKRKSLKSEIDQFLRISDPAAGDPVRSVDEYYGQAYDLISSPTAQQAFEIDRETDTLRDEYGRNGLGQRLLLSRRLVEAGVPFITVYEGGWDQHTNIFPGLKRKLPPLDQGLAALVKDLESRGLLDSTLIVVLGEFGRTPKINKGGGRDHWSNAMSVLMAGCRTPGGQVVGATDKSGYSAERRVLSPERFVSTVYTKLGIDPGQILYTPQGRPVHLVSDPRPIEELL